MLPNFAASVATSSNGTNEIPNLTHLPSNILEAFIPGYSLVSRFILEAFGFDVSVLVSVLALAFGVTTAANYAFRHLYSLGLTYLTASVTVDADDDIYDQVIAWVSDQRVTKRSRDLRVKSESSSAWDVEDDLPTSSGVPGGNSGALINFSNWESKVPLRFEPHEHSEWFWHGGNYFCMRRQKETVLGQRFGLSFMTGEERLTIMTLGVSTEPIKKLIREARNVALSRERSRTAVRRPGPKEIRARAAHAWSKVATRPSRPIETVVLGEEQKENVLWDINEYLHPATPRWYANRGIPYRRGYLFYGPPGTGKTSLSFAIAGVFGLDIYCVSLLDPSLTEEDLGILFNSLPRRCVVLLEDIDSAGLRRQAAKSESQAEAGKEDGKNAPKPPVASGVRMGRGKKDTEESPGISLSGLLNAIDGVASHEGRVLVMTTNHREQLDDALIRPGRVDMQIEFTLATKPQIRQIFVRMYSPDDKRGVSPNSQEQNGPNLHNGSSAQGEVNRPQSSSEKPVSSSPNPKSTALLSPPATPTESEQGNSSTNSSSSSGDRDETPASPSLKDNSIDTTLNIDSLSISFANHLPENTFSPAEIQGFLLTRKRDPLRAVHEVEKWRDDTIVAKKEDGNKKEE